MKYSVNRYPDARWDDDCEQWELGAPGERIMLVEAVYPAAAQSQALGALRLDVRGMTFLHTIEAIVAWDTSSGVVALVAEEVQS